MIEPDPILCRACQFYNWSKERCALAPDVPRETAEDSCSQWRERSQKKTSIGDYDFVDSSEPIFQRDEEYLG